MFEKGIILFLILWPAAAAFFGYILGRFSKHSRDYFVMTATVLEFAFSLVLCLGSGSASLSLERICGMGLSFKADGFRVIFAAVGCYMWMMTTLFSKDYLSHARSRNRYYFFLLITLGAVSGLFLSDDLFTTFVFFEIMSMASYVCVIHEEENETMFAGAVYLSVAIIGGMVTLMGLFNLYSLAGTLSFSDLLPAVESTFAGNESRYYLAGGLILIGFGAKAGMYPLHIWLPMAHPVAPAPASALLSGIITKTGIFGVLVTTSRIFIEDDMWGMAILLLGVITMLLGGILALFSLDIKRTLACSSMSQLGFIFVGTGMMVLLGEENTLAVRGTILHMFNHSNLKLVLFMAAGVVVMNLHKLDMNEIRGFGRKKPMLKYVFLMGSLGIGGIPLWNGYISKTLIHESIVEYTGLIEEGHISSAASVFDGFGSTAFFTACEWLFIITGAMTVAYMTKLFVVLFIEKNNDEKIQEKFDGMRNYMRPLTCAVLCVSASVLPILGLFPYVTLDKLADSGQTFLVGDIISHSVNYFSPENLKGGLYSILFGALIYMLFIRGFMMKKKADETTVYLNRWPVQFDLLKLIYEPVVMVLVPGIVAGICRIAEGLTDGLISFLGKTLYRPLTQRRKAEPGFIMSFAAGTVCNEICALLNLTIRRKNPVERDYILEFTEKERTLKEVNSIVAASASFSLLMFGVGLVITILYLFLS